MPAIVGAGELLSAQRSVGIMLVVPPVGVLLLLTRTVVLLRGRRWAGRILRPPCTVGMCTSWLLGAHAILRTYCVGLV